jgi:hypothetical protein
VGAFMCGQSFGGFRVCVCVCMRVYICGTRDACDSIDFQGFLELV